MAQTQTKQINPPKKYNFLDLEKLWVKAGGSIYLAPIMAAIALAESSGNPTNVGKNKNGTVDRGLWQINSSHNYGTSSFDPATNAKQALSIYNSQGLTAWSTFTNKKYLNFLPRGFDKAAADRFLSKHPTDKSMTTANTDVLTAAANSTGLTSGPGLGSKAAQDLSGPVNSIGSAIQDGIMLALKEGMYGLAIVGGTTLILLGLIFIGADLGLSGLHKTQPVRIIRSVTPSRKPTETVIDPGGGNLPGPEA